MTSRISPVEAGTICKLRLPWSGVSLSRLRTQILPTRAQLFKVHLIDTPLCMTCLLPETCGHFLFSCHHYHQLKRSCSKIWVFSLSEWPLRPINWRSFSSSQSGVLPPTYHQILAWRLRLICLLSLETSHREIQQVSDKRPRHNDFCSWHANILPSVFGNLWSLQEIIKVYLFLFFLKKKRLDLKN